ncbi:hypothetical protein NW768_007199 [Fusarium equiseti]|uniref:Uncharacterized protein n=1 Tax=Fusarium equiseti TaxID=61235 RepID=A0ABQ8RAM5_FUSEQ|nr:hypothetical protein NW768_007199 [Fusarium equiseti]
MRDFGLHRRQQNRIRNCFGEQLGCDETELQNVVEEAVLVVALQAVLAVVNRKPEAKGLVATKIKIATKKPGRTVTDTTTTWTTETETETITTDGTTTVESISTKKTTIYVTLSRDATADTTSAGETEGPAHRVKRTLPSSSAATHRERYHARARVSKTQHPINIRPVASLNALAEGLARRGVPIQRRATATTTVEKTIEATTTITETETETEWTTRYTTSVTIESHTMTVIAHKGSKTTITLDKAEETGDPINDGPGSRSGGPSKGTIIGAAVGGAVALILIAVLAFFLWRRRKPATNEARTVSQVYAVTGHDDPSQKPPPILSTVSSPAEQGNGPRNTWASSPQQDAMTDFSPPPDYRTPPPGELGHAQWAHEMPSSPQQGPPQELYNRGYMGDLGLPEMRGQQRD